MSEASLIGLTLLSAIAVILLVGPYSVKGLIWARTKKEPTFFGANLFYGSPAQIVDKYQLSLYAAPAVGGGLRPLSLIWNIAGMCFLLHRCLTGKGFNAPKKFYLSWISLWMTSIAWVFIFDREIQVLATIITVFVHVTASTTLKFGSEFYQRYSTKSKVDKEEGKLFRILVLEGIAMVSVWSFPATCMSFAGMLSYKDSLHSDVADLSGFLTPEEASTAGLVLILVRFVVWWIFDVIYWRKCSDAVHATYPTFAMIMFSIATNNYNSETGLTLNNMLALTSAIMSSVAFFTRGVLKNYFTGNRNDGRRHQD